MDRIIYKYPLKEHDEQLLELPAGAQILDVQMQDLTLVLWALVKINEPKKVPRLIRILYTGSVIDLGSSRLIHISTIQLGGLVLHVFEQTN